MAVELTLSLSQNQWQCFCHSHCNKFPFIFVQDADSATIAWWIQYWVKKRLTSMRNQKEATNENEIHSFFLYLYYDRYMNEHCTGMEQINFKPYYHVLRKCFKIAVGLTIDCKDWVSFYLDSLHHKLQAFVEPRKTANCWKPPGAGQRKSGPSVRKKPFDLKDSYLTSAYMRFPLIYFDVTQTSTLLSHTRFETRIL